MKKRPGPPPFWIRWNRENWRLLSAETLAKHLRISLPLATKAKANWLVGERAWTGTPEDQREMDRGAALMTAADLDALADAQVAAREREAEALRFKRSIAR